MITKQFTITAEVGLHARPATQLVQEASRYSSHIELEYNEKKVNVKSIMGVMSLGIAQGATFSIIIDGHDEEEAMKGIEALFTNEGIAE
ncbi:phosphocarrier protein HPr [Pseudogracilibacillus auburnensis]|uniref:phosphocarrier protein HPr n=1 Tax=Pseudogracilibacillus auburnensis TaxID=1494959 RepID=UPI001F617C8B|nr:phosphocarrier protein HPr [Pseudogracilibacillus auburnensis]